MSILSSSLTGDFIRASASTARSRGADLAADRPPFRDHLDAARSSHLSDRPDPGADAVERRDAAREDDAEAAEAADERRAEREDVDRSETRDGREDADEESTAAGVVTITPASEEAGVATAEDRTTGDRTQARARGADATITPGEASAAAGLAGATDGGGTDRVDVAVPAADARTLRDGGAVVTGTPAADATVLHGGAAVETAAATVQASAGPAAASTADASRATETGDRTARGGGEAAARAGGRFELDGAASRPETTIDRSAYRSAMADRAAGRDLAPAERQARAIDERIALARTEAAARASGTSSGTMVARGQGLAAAATAGPALPPSGRGMSAVGGATREAAPLTASSGGTTSPPPTGAAATNPGVVDGGVPARPGPMAPAGVPADAAGSATGRPTADEAVAHALRGVRMLTGRGGGTMTLRLQPGDLGDLRVRVDIRGGRVTAEFKTTTEAARSQIERGLETLRRGLEERGLQVERLTVRGGESEGARPNADGSRAGRDDSADGRDRGGGGSGDGGRDDAAGRQSDGRRDESQGRRPLGERASSPDALRAFASIFGERLQ